MLKHITYSTQQSTTPPSQTPPLSILLPVPSKPWRTYITTIIAKRKPTASRKRLPGITPLPSLQLQTSSERPIASRTGQLMIAPPPSLQTSRLAMRKPTASRSRQPVITPMVATALTANNEKAHRVSSETAGHHSSMAFDYSDEHVSCTYLRNPDLQAAISSPDLLKYASLDTPIAPNWLDYLCLFTD